MTKYLIDSNVFIQAKNMYYRFDFCGGFWDWVRGAHDAGLVFTINKVKDELQAGADACCEWSKTLPATFFLKDMADPAVMKVYADVMQWAYQSDFKPAAKDEFAKQTVADAFLIATAKAYKYSIVTQEQSNPAARKKIYLPDAAMAFGVETKYVYDMLSEHSISTFVQKPPQPRPRVTPLPPRP